MSKIGWIDFDQDEHNELKKALHFDDSSDAHDELGLGTVRDALSNLMFPGVSSLQTRLRYLLFVPWIFKQAMNSPRTERSDFVKQKEIELIDALKAANENNGVIGISVGKNLQNWPSEIYWSGLKKLGILVESYSRDQVLNMDNTAKIWAPNLPSPPVEFLHKTSFGLRRVEANFIRNQLATNAPDSLLKILANNTNSEQCKLIWDHSGLRKWPKENRKIVVHAKRLAIIMHGGALLYNLMLARKMMQRRESEPGSWSELSDRYQNDLDSWRSKDPVVLISKWDLKDFWHTVTKKNSNIPLHTRYFIQDWCNAVRSSNGKIENCSIAKNLITKREKRSKELKARLTHDDALDKWSGFSGANIMKFRWNVAMRHLEDIANAK